MGQTLLWALVLAAFAMLGCGPSIEGRIQTLVAEAEAGDPDAMYNIARRYAAGNGLERDLDEARYWHVKAAEAGVAEAQFQLALLIDQEQLGFTRDAEEVQSWLRFAAMQGHLDAQLQLSERYRDGRGFEANPGKSQAWLRHAAAQGHPRARVGLASAYLNGALPHRSDNLGVAYLHDAAELGSAEHQLLLGFMYGHGLGVPQDRETADLWLRRAGTTKPQEADVLAEIIGMVSQQQCPWQEETRGPVRYPLRLLYGASALPARVDEVAAWYRMLIREDHRAANYDLARLQIRVAETTEAALENLRIAQEAGRPEAVLALKTYKPDAPTLEPESGD